MQLEPIMTYHADLAAPQDVGKTAFGTRQIFEVTGGTFEGPELKGEILTCGGDWLLVDDEGIGRLDVRATFRTHDGAHIYMQYFGVLELNEATDSPDETVDRALAALDQGAVHLTGNFRGIPLVG